MNTYNLSDWTVPRNRLVIAYLAALVLPTAAGCGQGPKYATATVSGHIAIDGQPVPRGAVTFSPMTGTSGAVVGGEIKTGEYRCDGVPLGKLNVTFVAQAAKLVPFVEKATGQTRQVPKDILPARYANGITVEITGNRSDLNFDLKHE